jgi:hypothetical protein
MLVFQHSFILVFYERGLRLLDQSFDAYESVSDSTNFFKLERTLCETACVSLKDRDSRPSTDRLLLR